MNEIILVVIFNAALGKEKALTDRLREMSVLSLAEDGCSVYSLHVDVNAPKTLLLYEVWRDQAALDAHDKTDHVARFIRDLPSLVLKPFDRKILARLT